MIGGALTLMIGIATAVTAATGKPISNPWAGLADQQEQAQMDAAHSANVKYLLDFQARHGDPRSLSVIKISTYQPPSASLGSAATQANIIVHGRVKSVQFGANPSGGIPKMTADVVIADVGKGSAGPAIVVAQAGGPVAQPNGGGALVELEYEHLMLPGDEVLLLLAQMSADVAYRPIYGAGVLLIQNGRLFGESSARYGVTGKDYRTVWNSLVDPNVPLSAYPMQHTQGNAGQGRVADDFQTGNQVAPGVAVR